MPIFFKHSHFQSIVSGKAFHNGVLGKPIDPCQQCMRKRAYERPFPTQSTLICLKNHAKLVNDCVSRNGHIEYKNYSHNQIQWSW